MQEQAVSGRPGRAAREIVTIDSEQRVIAAARIMTENNVGCLVVVNDQGRLVGVVDGEVVTWFDGTPNPSAPRCW